MSETNPSGRSRTSRSPLIQAAVTIALLGAVVWAIRPSHLDLKPAPLRPALRGPDCPRLLRNFTPTNITDIPEPLFVALSEKQKDQARFRLNMEPCSCGCNLSIVACRADHSRCKSSERLLQTVVTEEKGETGLSETR